MGKTEYIVRSHLKCFIGKKSIITYINFSADGIMDDFPQ